MTASYDFQTVALMRRVRKVDITKSVFVVWSLRVANFLNFEILPWWMSGCLLRFSLFCVYDRGTTITITGNRRTAGDRKQQEVLFFWCEYVGNVPQIAMLQCWLQCRKLKIPQVVYRSVYRLVPHHASRTVTNYVTHTYTAVHSGLVF